MTVGRITGSLYRKEGEADGTVRIEKRGEKTSFQIMWKSHVRIRRVTCTRLATLVRRSKQVTMTRNLAST